MVMLSKLVLAAGAAAVAAAAVMERCHDVAVVDNLSFTFTI
jgi:hypothetical protein